MIKIRNLTKQYENLIAPNNVNLEIEKNEVFGLLGPNSVDKTTVIHMLSTPQSTSGTAIVNGYDFLENQQKLGHQLE